MNPTKQHIREFVTAFITVVIGGNTAPIGYVIGVALCMIGFILLMDVEEINQIILSSSLCLLGLIIVFFRIRKDLLEIRNETK